MELKNAVNVWHTDYKKVCAECHNKCIRGGEVKNKQISVYTVKGEDVYYCQVCKRYWR